MQVRRVRDRVRERDYARTPRSLPVHCCTSTQTRCRARRTTTCASGFALMRPRVRAVRLPPHCRCPLRQRTATRTNRRPKAKWPRRHHRHRVSARPQLHQWRPAKINMQTDTFLLNRSGSGKPTQTSCRKFDVQVVKRKKSLTAAEQPTWGALALAE